MIRFVVIIVRLNNTEGTYQLLCGKKDLPMTRSCWAAYGFDCFCIGDLATLLCTPEGVGNCCSSIKTAQKKLSTHHTFGAAIKIYVLVPIFRYAFGGI